MGTRNHTPATVPADADAIAGSIAALEYLATMAMSLSLGSHFYRAGLNVPVEAADVAHAHMQAAILNRGLPPAQIDFANQTADRVFASLRGVLMRNLASQEGVSGVETH